MDGSLFEAAFLSGSSVARAQSATIQETLCGSASKATASDSSPHPNQDSDPCGCSPGTFFPAPKGSLDKISDGSALPNPSLLPRLKGSPAEVLGCPRVFSRACPVRIEKGFGEGMGVGPPGALDRPKMGGLVLLEGGEVGPGQVTGSQAGVRLQVPRKRLASDELARPAAKR